MTTGVLYLSGIVLVGCGGATDTSLILEDIDFLTHTLEANFPHFNAAERVFGIDVDEIMANTRQEAQNHTSFRNQQFENFLRSNFFVHFDDHFYANFGLLEPLATANVQFHVNHRQRNQWTQVLDNPATRSFYGLTGNAFERVPTGAGNHPNAGRILTTESLEEGRIALITVPRVFNNWLIDDHTEELLAFAQTIADYEHLIIDMTHIGGWEMGWFPQVIIQNLISQPVTYSHNFFSMGGEHVRQFYSMLPSGEAGFMPVSDELLAQFPSLHPDDIGLFRYHYYMQGTIHPSDRSIGFGGKIWLLISSNNIYSSDYVASLVQETGFATLVGEPTSGGGITSMFSVPLVLPNTGMVVRFMPLYGTDHLGRNTWEHPTQPDIFNREGMDAMQTVLALIAEGNY